MTATTIDITDAERNDGMDGGKVVVIELDAADVVDCQYVRILVNGVEKGGVRITPTEG